ncbi:hypothetical protein [Streptomyces avicenniae]|uniref:hypothetical protein n=1 Tax=Streptomyces avicenniae TaxID=500153 RepID=UPI00069BB034|nr:hypothetical protein [Streptomyces avicenniae]
MLNLLGRAGDRLLEAVAPKAVAKADATFKKRCYCHINGAWVARTCHVVGGMTGCGPCNTTDGPC